MNWQKENPCKKFYAPEQAWRMFVQPTHLRLHQSIKLPRLFAGTKKWRDITVAPQRVNQPGVDSWGYFNSYVSVTLTVICKVPGLMGAAPPTPALFRARASKTGAGALS